MSQRAYRHHRPGQTSYKSVSPSGTSDANGQRGVTTDPDLGALPSHIEEALAAIALMQERHDRATRPIQRLVERATRTFARPGMVVALLAITASWMLINWHMARAGARAPDPPPFQGLQVALGVMSIVLTCLILTTQKRDDVLAGHRAHLTLELAILAERKSAKAIELLEELRRDLPQLHDRIDEDAQAMASPTDPGMVLDALVRSQPETED